MKIMNLYRALPVIMTWLFACSNGWSADLPKLAAPIYKGAVPAVLADGVKADPFYIRSFSGVKALDCHGLIESRNDSGYVISAKDAEKAGLYPGPWCFLSRDPIDKVRAFYDKAVGPMHALKGGWGKNSSTPVQGFQGLAEQAWFSGNNEMDGGTGYRFTAVSLHALPPPSVPAEEKKTMGEGFTGQGAYQFYAGSRHFNGFLNAVDWFGDPGKHKQSELLTLYKQHMQLESALFQRKGPKLTDADEMLRGEYADKLKKAQDKSMGMMPGMGQMSPEQAAQMQQMMQMMQKGQIPTAMAPIHSATPNDAKFNAFMKKNPKVAKRYMELTGKLGTLTQQGKFNEADAVDSELQQLIDANPELAALEKDEDENNAAAGAAQGSLSQGAAPDEWKNWLNYINAAEKQAYYTLIVIDNGFRGNEKSYSRDQAVIAKNSSGWVSHQQVWDFSFDVR